MNILISEDSDTKYFDILGIVKEIFPDAKVKRRANVFETIRTFKTNEFDILIQDMQLPLRADEVVHPSGGVNSFLYAIDEGISKLILCSSDSEAKEAIKDFEEVEFIHYNTFRFDEMKEQFKNILGELNDV